MLNSAKPASKKRREYRRSQTVLAIPLRKTKTGSISIECYPASGLSLADSGSVSRRCSSGPNVMIHQQSSASLRSTTMSDGKRHLANYNAAHGYVSHHHSHSQQSGQQRQRKVSSTSSSASITNQDISYPGSRKSSDSSSTGSKCHPPLIPSYSYGNRKLSQQSIITAATAVATRSAKRLGRTPSSPSVLFSKVKEKIREKVVEASTEWPQMAIIVQERRQRAADEFEARLQHHQQQFLQHYNMLPQHQQHLLQQCSVVQPGQQRRSSDSRRTARTISSDQIILGSRLQDYQGARGKRYRAKSDSGQQRAHSCDREYYYTTGTNFGQQHQSAYHQHKETPVHGTTPPDTGGKCHWYNRSNSTSINSTSINSSSNSSSVYNIQLQQLSQQSQQSHYKGIFGLRSSCKRKSHLLSRMGGSVDVQTARSYFRRRSISDDVTNQPLAVAGTSGHVMSRHGKERKNSKCGTGIVCSDDDLRAIVIEHRMRRSPVSSAAPASKHSNTATATAAEMAANSAAKENSRSASPATSSAKTPVKATTSSSSRKMLFKQASFERYSPVSCSQTIVASSAPHFSACNSCLSKDYQFSLFPGKPVTPSDVESESGTSTGRTSPKRSASPFGDVRDEPVCITVQMTESESETQHPSDTKNSNYQNFQKTLKSDLEEDLLSKPRFNVEVQDDSSSVKNIGSSRESFLIEVKKSSIEVPEVTFDERGQTWDVYGAEFDPEIVGQAIQMHLEKIMQKRLHKNNDNKTIETQTSTISYDEKPKKTKRKNKRKTAALQRNCKEVAMETSDASGDDYGCSRGRYGVIQEIDDDNSYEEDEIIDMTDDNEEMSDNEVISDNMSYRRRVMGLISRYFCSLVSRRETA